MPQHPSRRPSYRDAASTPPPPPHACAVAMLPAASARLVPHALQPLFNEGSVIACYFAAERCVQCKRYRAQLGALQKLREAEVTAA